MNKAIYTDTANTTMPVETIRYEYDTNNRVVKETDDNSITTISYNGNTISAVKVPNVGTTTKTTTLTTNSVGLVTKKIHGYLFPNIFI